MMGFVIIAVFALYACLGSKLNKNFIGCGLIGLGVLVSIPLLTSPVLFIFRSAVTGLIFWGAIQFISILFTLMVAAVIAYRNNLIFK